MTDGDAAVFLKVLAGEMLAGKVPDEAREAIRLGGEAIRVKVMLVEALVNAKLICTCGRPDRCESEGRGPCSYVAVTNALLEARKP